MSKHSQNFQFLPNSVNGWQIWKKLKVLGMFRQYLDIIWKAPDNSVWLWHPLAVLKKLLMGFRKLVKAIYQILIVYWQLLTGFSQPLKGFSHLLARIVIFSKASESFSETFGCHWKVSGRLYMTLDIYVKFIAASDMFLVVFIWI